MAAGPAARHLRTSISRAVVGGRANMGWSQRELARAAGVSTGMVALVELGKANVTVDTAGRLLSALGLAVDLQISFPLADPRQRDVAHVRCVAYVQRRLERQGWLVRREVEIVHGRSHGWIDLLAFDNQTRTLVVVEVKTELHDIGAIERTMAWYEREAWGSAQRLRWLPVRVRGLLLVLATDGSDARSLPVTGERGGAVDGQGGRLIPGGLESGRGG